jgi:integrase
MARLDALRALSPSELGLAFGDRVEWDRRLPGFGVRCHASGRRVYIVVTRMRGAVQKITLGSAKVLGLRQARRTAAILLLDARTGGDPAATRRAAKANQTMAEFAERYWRMQARVWKPSTRVTHEIYRDTHILPGLGRLFVDQVDEAAVTRWYARIATRSPGAANRALDLLRHMLKKAEEWGFRAEASNPCRWVRRHRGKLCKRFLTEPELARLGAVLDAQPARCARHVAAVRLLLLTGCRKGEVLGLEWRDMRGDCLVLRDSKTGPRTVMLGDAATEVLRALPRDGRHVFRDAEQDRPLRLDFVWHRFRREAGLPGLRLHDLRHTFASHGMMMGENLPTVGQLLGHAKVDSTARYSHLDDRTALEAVERIGAVIDRLLDR